MSTFKDRINEAMALRNMKAVDISEKTGISKARISQYVNGIYTPKSKATYIIAKALNVSETWLMGLDVPMENSSSDLPPQKTSEPTVIDPLDEKILELFAQLTPENKEIFLGKLVQTLASQGKK